MKDTLRVSDRVMQIQKSAIHEMTRLSKEVEDVAFLSWAKPTSDTPEHIKEAAIAAIQNGLVGGYSETSGLKELREEIVGKLKRDSYRIEPADGVRKRTIGILPMMDRPQGR